MATIQQREGEVVEEAIAVNKDVAQRIADILSDFSMLDDPVGEWNATGYFGSVMAALTVARPALGMNDDNVGGALIGFMTAVEYVKRHSGSDLIPPIVGGHTGETQSVRGTRTRRSRKGKDGGESPPIG